MDLQQVAINNELHFNILFEQIEYCMSNRQGHYFWTLNELQKTPCKGQICNGSTFQIICHQMTVLCGKFHAITKCTVG